jgi:glycosyltransferase involved in cell wall biosynthesis
MIRVQDKDWAQNWRSDMKDLSQVAVATQIVRNCGWYGCRMLIPAERFDSFSQNFDGDRSLNIDNYDRETAIIAERYGGRGGGFELDAVWRSGEIDRHFASISARQDVPGSTSEPSFSFVTSFYGGSLEYLRQCARSLADIHRVGQDKRHQEWIVVNGDPLVSNEAILDVIPSSLSRYTALSRDNQDSGLSGRLNKAILASQGEWILFVDADDLVMPDTIAVLEHYIRRFPKCRYISSAMIDVDENNQILRHRLHLNPPTRLFSAGMIAGHLKAVRRDLFGDVGLLDPAFDLAQDYEFALRVAAFEPLLLIPDYLYCYRWHKNTQSVSRRERQSAARDRARESAVVRLTTNRILPTWPWAIRLGSLKLAHFLQRNAPVVLVCALVVGRKVWRFFKKR